MITRKRDWLGVGARVLLCAFVACCACDDDDGNGESASGAMLRGTVTQFDVPPASPAAGVTGGAQVEGVRVAIGDKDTQTDANGDFVLDDIPVGDQVVEFSKDQTAGIYTLSGVVAGGIYVLDDVQYSGGMVSTAHTGIWEGFGGSDDPGGHGQIALTIDLEANGNILSGTASIGAPDSSTWSLSGTEDGTAVNGSMSVVFTLSECASGGTFTGAFDADTLSATFIEVDPPAGCGPPETGSFRVVKQ